MFSFFQRIGNSIHFNCQSKAGVAITYKEDTISEDEIRQKLLEIHNSYKEKAILEDAYYLLGSRYFLRLIEEGENLDSLWENIVPIFRNWDETDVKIPLSLGESLEEKMENDTTHIGIHRSDLISNDGIQDSTLQSIMKDGLINYGSCLQGAMIEGVMPLSKTISPCNHMLGVVILLKSSYKDSKGAVILEFPSDVVDENLDFFHEEEAEKIYKIQDGNYVVRPKFLLGFAQLDWSHQTITYSDRETILQASKDHQII